MNLTHTLPFAIIAALTFGVSAHADVVYSEDFSTFANEASVSQGGWGTQIGDGVDVIGQRLGGDGSDGASIHNTALSMSAGTQSVTFTTTQRIRNSSGFRVLFSIYNTAGARIIEYGGGNGTAWFIRGTGGDIADDSATDGTDDGPNSSSHVFYTFKFEYDFLTDSGVVSLRNQAGDANFTTLLNVTAASLGLTAAMDDPNEWGRIAARITNAGDQLDDIHVTSIIPTPAALPAGLALIGLAAARRRRRRIV